MSIHVVHHEVFDHEFNGEAEPFVRVSPHCQHPLERLYHYRTLAATVFERKVPGDILDCGAGNGGTAALLAHTSVRRGGCRHVWMFEKFDVEGKGDSEGYGRPASIDECRRAMYGVGVDEHDFTIKAGSFDKKFAQAKVREAAVLRLGMKGSGDVMDALRRFYDPLQEGGLILLDWYGTQDAYRVAVDHFFAVRELDVTLVQIDESAYYAFKEHAPYYEDS